MTNYDKFEAFLKDVKNNQPVRTGFIISNPVSEIKEQAMGVRAALSAAIESGSCGVKKAKAFAGKNKKANKNSEILKGESIFTKEMNAEKKKANKESKTSSNKKSSVEPSSNEESCKKMPTELEPCIVSKEADPKMNMEPKVISPKTNSDLVNPQADENKESGNLKKKKNNIFKEGNSVPDNNSQAKKTKTVKLFRANDALKRKRSDGPKTDRGVSQPEIEKEGKVLKKSKPKCKKPLKTEKAVIGTSSQPKKMAVVEVPIGNGVAGDGKGGVQIEKEHITLQPNEGAKGLEKDENHVADMTSQPLTTDLKPLDSNSEEAYKKGETRVVKESFVPSFSKVKAKKAFQPPIAHVAKDLPVVNKVPEIPPPEAEKPVSPLSNQQEVFNLEDPDFDKLTGTVVHSDDSNPFDF